MPQLVPFISAAASIFGIVSGVKSMQAAKKAQAAPAPVAAPAAPQPADAAAQAAEATKKRRQRMMSTDLTRGQALVPQVNVEQKSLIGA